MVKQKIGDNLIRRNSLTKKTEADAQFLSNGMQCRRKMSSWRAALGRGRTTEAWSKESEYVTVQNEKLAGEEEDGVNASWGVIMHEMSG